MRLVVSTLLTLSLAGVALAQNDWTKAANLSVFTKEVKMAPEHKAMLAKNLFFVAPVPGQIQMHYVFDENDYKNIPSLVTIDLPMHLYHILFDATLRTTESSSLYPRAQAMTVKLINATKKAYDGASDATIKQAHLKNLAYFGVANRLFGGSAPLPAAAMGIVNQELAMIKAHNAYAKGAVFPYEIDYTQFIVRGHYTKSPTLSKYFEGMMWFGLAPFAMCPAGKIEPDNAMVLRALALSQVFTSSGSEAAWNAIYEPTTLFAGKVNSLTPAMVAAAWKKVAPTASITKTASYPDLCKELFRVNPSLYKPQIVMRGEQPATGLQLRFMPQRGLLDGLAISRVTVAMERPLPSGLDVMAMLGSNRAAEILDASPATYNPNNWSDYLPNRKSMTAYIEGLPAETWKRNLYDAWLDTLRQAVHTPNHALPSFMKTAAYKDKNLNTALASYAELRHDTLLYGEQTAVEMGDGDEEQPYVRHYVEPNLPVYERLTWSVRTMRDGLNKYHLLTPDSQKDVEGYGGILSFLKSCVEKELAGAPLGKANHNRIRKIGGEIEDLTTTLLMRGLNYNTLTEKDRDMAIVADIHAANPLAFEIASGHAEDLIALVPIEGKMYLARGPVYSYYEFTVPMSERLTDDAWKKMLEDGKQPERPKWMSSFRVAKPAREIE